MTVALIPKGSVRSYKWVACKAGRPRAYRAVGNALNKNRHPSVIPCHRVIKSDGSIGGYAGGAKLKRRLLRREGHWVENTAFSYDLNEAITRGICLTR